MHREYEEAYKFMFTINKEGRYFLLKNFITIRNGFINDGLIPFEWKCDFNSSLSLERLYQTALTRNVENRILTLSIDIDRWKVKYCNEVVKWIKAQQQNHHIKLLFRV